MPSRWWRDWRRFSTGSRLMRFWTWWNNVHGRKYPLQLIQGFIAHAVKKLLRRRGIHTVVVLADEVARAKEAFVKEYNLGASRQDITSLLRQAILDQEILPGLQATLVISSLTLSPLGASPFGRFPRVLELAQNLNATKVATSWWCKELLMMMWQPSLQLPSQSSHGFSSSLLTSSSQKTSTRRRWKQCLSMCGRGFRLVTSRSSQRRMPSTQPSLARRPHRTRMLCPLLRTTSSWTRSGRSRHLGLPSALWLNQWCRCSCWAQ